MYGGAIAGLYLIGIYGGLLLVFYILGWSNASWEERFHTFLVLLFLGFGFGVFWYAKDEALKREPVISSCVMIGNQYQMVDSTLRCETGEEPRYTVLKKKKEMKPNEQTKCINCGQIMVEHCDQSCMKTKEEIHAENMIDYLNAPL